MAWKALRGAYSTPDQTPQHSGVATPGGASLTFSVLQDEAGEDRAWSGLGASSVRASMATSEQARGDPAVHRVVHAGDEPGVVGGEVDDHLGDVVGLRQPALHARHQVVHLHSGERLER